MPEASESQTKAEFEEVEHTADWALRVRGQDLSGLLLNAARGMLSLLVVNPTLIPLEVEEQIDLEAGDAEGLLVDWLSELVYRAEVEGVLFREFNLQQVTPTHLRVAIRGGPVPSLHKHIKAVTYHNLEIIKTEKGLEATIVFDV
jgi:SHS2 domain-containing protein